MTTYRIPNSSKVYKQYDSRWGYLPYPTKNSTLAGSGCGDCAVCHCAMEVDGQSGYTPKTTYKFMKQYAVAGHGTKWVGILEGLKHFGLQNVREVDTMSELFQLMKKGNVVAVLLFNNRRGGSRNILWTSGGHYVAAVGMKTDGKETYLYTKDSGGRGHDGWYGYNSSIRGAVSKIWVGTVPRKGIKLPSRGYFKDGDKGENVLILQKWLNDVGFDCGKEDGIYGKLTMAGVKKFQRKYGLKVDGLWGKECQKKYLALK